MSTFSGKMKEYLEISIDRFDGKNLDSTAFFLSHCHRDHMIGLAHRRFFDRLKKSSPDVFLYMTDVSKVLLMGDNSYNFHHLEPYIKTLQKGENTVYLPQDNLSKPKFVSVTTLPAGHCPGSVMFLFEGNEGSVLYTGDFRWEVNSASKCPALKNELGIKPIKSLYIDTTFCIPNAFHFPSRAQCVEVTVELVKEWLNYSPSNFVFIASPANYGHEHLHVEIFKNTRHKIHTSDWKFSVYSQIQDLSSAYTTDPSSRIHACGLRKKSYSKSFLPCGHLFDTENEELKLLVIKPSTMWFTMSTIRSEILVEKPSKLHEPHRVCYSFHSSYSEIKDLVSYLNPDQVFPNVIPAQEPDDQIVQARLNSFLKPKEILEIQKSFLGELNVKLSAKRLKSPSFSDSEELVFESPVKIKKRKFSTEVTIRSSPDKTHHVQVDGFEKPSPAKSYADSSYEESNDSGSEMDLCVTPIKNSQNSNHSNLCVTPIKTQNSNHSNGLDINKSSDSNLNEIRASLEKEKAIIQSWQEDTEALRLYVSSDSDGEKDDDGDDGTFCEKNKELNDITKFESNQHVTSNFDDKKNRAANILDLDDQKTLVNNLCDKKEEISKQILNPSTSNIDNQNKNCDIQKASDDNIPSLVKTSSFKDDLDDLLDFKNTTSEKTKSSELIHYYNHEQTKMSQCQGPDQRGIREERVKDKSCHLELKKDSEKISNMGNTLKVKKTKIFTEEIIIIDTDSEPSDQNSVCSQSNDSILVCSQSNDRTLINCGQLIDQISNFSQSIERTSNCSQSNDNQNSPSILTPNLSNMPQIVTVGSESDSDTLPPSQNSFHKSSAHCDEEDVEIISDDEVLLI